MKKGNNSPSFRMQNIQIKEINAELFFAKKRISKDTLRN